MTRKSVSGERTQFRVTETRMASTFIGTIWRMRSPRIDLENVQSVLQLFVGRGRLRTIYSQLDRPLTSKFSDRCSSRSG